MKYSKYIKYFCKICNKELSYDSARKGGKSCKKCYLNKIRKPLSKCLICHCILSNRKAKRCRKHNMQKMAIQRIIKLNKNKIIMYYIKKNYALRELPKIFKCSAITIFRRIQQYNIKKKRAIACKKPKITKFNQQITKNKLIKIYPDKIKYQKDIAKLFKCNRKTIEYYLRKYNIKRLSPSERLKGANYFNGMGYLRYPSIFNDILKNLIRKRDNYKCQKCSIKEKAHIKLYKRVLDVHHIDYNKFNCSPKNLISLCQKCNCKVNADKDYWYAYFNYKMEKK